ncbi:MAG TPA: intradiol ring-cleavage dioxygenase [Candidatus Corynebacterium avicola]|uniref:Intradiol ring-cleavage dioxygenase n=1 Tax=Candidatus Corynebacterium avicola TaxID=2838527 RepID=A0A9D1RQM5_9CORY|nr:intradiol ring-cleavage dioxygenase [Candidatus Corynebacterium avicola]
MATGVPEPTQTPEGPAYEGRLLDRPDDEVVDQGVSFDVKTLMSRRMFLGVGAAGVGSLALVACSTDSSSSAATTSADSTSAAASGDLPSAEIPDETAGPYPADGSNGPDILSESGIERSDIRSNIGEDNPVDGVPLEFTLTITDMANDDAPFEGVAVYAWHCNALGEYSMYSEGVEDDTWLRGVQVADANGQVTYTSIVPACYTGRWPHIHFEVYPDIDSIDDAENAISTSQLAIPEDVATEVYELDTYEGSTENMSEVTLESDNVFGDDGGELQIATMSGDIDNGYTASLTVRVDTSTEPTGGAAPAGGGEGGPGGEPPEGGMGGEPPAGEPPAGSPGAESEDTGSTGSTEDSAA